METYERYDAKTGRNASASEVHGHHQRLKADLVRLQDEKKALESKANSEGRRREKLSKDIEEIEGRVKEGLIENVKGAITDAEYDEMKAHLADLKARLDDSVQKSDAIRIAIKQNQSIQDKVKKFVISARLHFIQASYRELAKRVKDDQADIIAQLWAIKSATPSATYQGMLAELFPMLPLGDHIAKRKAFLHEYGL